MARPRLHLRSLNPANFSNAISKILVPPPRRSLMATQEELGCGYSGIQGIAPEAMPWNCYPGKSGCPENSA